jgi:hypothetical protein
MTWSLLSARVVAALICCMLKLRPSIITQL